jgi:4-hydroxybenzoate polyprenyltransferase
MAIKEYLKLSRSFNAALTGISPVMGAIAMEQYNLIPLLLLFIVGFFGHTYGFVLNDILDYKIDKSSKEISDRPLISRTITLKKAWSFAIFSLIISSLSAFHICNQNQLYFPLIFIGLSAAFITIYNTISKKLPLMDIFVGLGIFSLILFGAATEASSFSNISFLAWMVCILGTIQVLFMQIIAGGLKDIENDFKQGANTFATRTGVRVLDKKLIIPPSFKITAYLIQIIDLFLVFFTIYHIWGFKNLESLEILILCLIAAAFILMFYISNKLLSIKIFNRDKARKLIGSHYMINFAVVPVMLMFLNPWTGIIVFFPALGFVLSNLILHGTVLQPKTM